MQAGCKETQIFIAGWIGGMRDGDSSVGIRTRFAQQVDEQDAG